MAAPQEVLKLQQFKLFDGLDEVVLQQLEQSIRWRKFDRGDVVCRKNDASDGMLMLLSGQLQVLEVLEDGREVGLNLIKASTFFGELSVIDGLPRSAHIKAIKPSVVGLLPQPTAREFFFKVPALAEAMMCHLAGMVRAMTRQRILLGMPSAFQRVYALLDQMKVIAPGGLVVVQQMPKQHEMAIMLNTSRETVSRAIANLVEQSVLIKDYQRLIVRKPEVLEQLARQTDHPPPRNDSTNLP